MKIDTRYFDEIEFDEKEIITFSDGIIGFRELKKYLLVTDGDNRDTGFRWLQSVEDTELVFILINVFEIIEDYRVEIDDEEMKVLEIEDMNDVLVYAVVVIPDNKEEIRANLRAPIIINTKNKRAKQFIIENSEYPIRFYFKRENI